MNIGMIACSGQAYELMQRVKREWESRHHADEVWAKVKCSAMPHESMNESLGECVGGWWNRTDAIVFFCAAGIAVRSIAPFIGHKSTDPAVLAIDETGAFCIPLLSGHMGGANELARQLADIVHAVPVITTATDREGKFAVDDFARKNNLAIRDWKKAKEISVRILGGQTIRMAADIPGLEIMGAIPDEVVWCGKPENTDAGIARGAKAEHHEAATTADERTESSRPDVLISYIDLTKALPENEPRPDCLQLIPRILVAGIGCRKGTTKERIAAAVLACMEEEGVLGEALFAAASIDLKKDEPGLVEYCRERGLPLITYPADMLAQVKGEFSESAFVGEVTGVTNVCERSAVLATGGILISRKKIYGGVTVALAEKKGSVTF